MKKKSLLFVIVAALLAMSLFVFGCAQKPEEDGPEPTPDAPKVTLDRTSARLDLYETVKLNATKENTDEAVVFSTSAPSVATVTSDGVVSSVSAGSAVITASAGGASATCAIEVYDSGISPVLVLSNVGADKLVSVSKKGEFSSYEVNVKTRWKNADLNEPVEYTWALAPEAAEGIADFTTADNGASVTFTGKEWGETSFTVTANVHGELISETLRVQVVNLSVKFASETLEKSSGGFAADLSLAEKTGDGYGFESVEAGITATDEDEPVDPDAIVYEITSGEEFIDFTDGTITAKAEGVAVISGSYDSASFKITVNVYRPEITIGETKRLMLETVNDADHVLESGLIGSVENAMLGDVDILDTYGAGAKTINFKTQNFPTEGTAMGDCDIAVNTERARFTIKAHIATMYIDSEDDLNTFMEKGMAIYTALGETKVVKGLYELTKDIHCTGEYTANPTRNWNQNQGFRGIFEGNGHVIYNFTVNKSMGLFDNVGSGGTIRNFAMVNAKRTANAGTHGSHNEGSILSTVCWGTFTDIYISVDIDSEVTGFGDCKAINVITGGALIGSKFTRCFVEYANKSGDPLQGFMVTNPAYMSYFDSCFAVGADKVSGKADEATDADNYGAYNTYADLKEANRDFSEWSESDMWTLVNGLPVPKKLAETANYANVAITNGSQDSTTIVPYGGGKFKVNATGVYKQFTVTEGYTVDRFGNVTIPQSVATSGGTFTVTVTSALDPTKTASATFRVLNTQVAEIADDVEFKSLNGAATFGIDLSELSDEVADIATAGRYSLFGVSSAAIDFNDADHAPAFSGGTLTLPTKDLTNHWGVNNFTVTLNKHDGSEVVGQLNIAVTLKVVTMYINSTETLNSFIQFSRDNGIVDAKNNANGYYEVNESFTYTGTYDVFGTSYGGNATENDIQNGFAGTFEGNGNVIGNLVVTRGGLFGQNNSRAQILNIAFVNAGKADYSNGSGGFFGAVTRALYKNVYISINDRMTTQGNSWAKDSSIFGFTSDGARYYNIVVDYVNIDSTNGGTYYPHLMPTPTKSNTWSNLLAVGGDGKICISDAPDATKNCYAVTSWSEVATCGIDLTKFTTENDGATFWTLVNGLPVPKKLAQTANYSNVAIIGGSSETTVIPYGGGTYKVNATGIYKQFTVTEGYTIDRFGVVTIPESVATNGGVFTVTVTSVLDPTKTASATYRIYRTRNVSVNTDVEYAALNGAATFDIDLSELLGDTVTDIAAADKYVLFGVTSTVIDFNDADNAPAFSAGRLTLSAKDLTNHWGTNTFAVTLDEKEESEVVGQLNITVTLKVVTMYIDDESDLNTFMEKGMAIYTALGETKVVKGLYELTKDIHCTGEYTANPTRNWNQNQGFRGIFEGNGHVIYNFTVNKSMGLFDNVGSGGTIRNFAMVNAKRTANAGTHNGHNEGSILSTVCWGTFTDIYISVDVDSEVTGFGDCKAINVITGGALAGSKFTRCFVEYTNKSGDPKQGFMVTNPAYMSYFDSCFAVGADKVSGSAKEEANATAYGAYKTYADLKEANRDFSAWATHDMWTLVNGLPVPKKLAQTANYTNVAIIGGSSETTVIPYGNGKFKVNATGVYKQFTVSEGYTIDRFGVVTIPESVATNGGAFTVTVTSALDPTKTASATFRILKTRIASLSTDVEFASASNGMVTLDFGGLSASVADIATAGKYSFFGVSSDTFDFGDANGAAFSAGKLTLPREPFKGKWGKDKAMTVILNEHDGGEIIGQLSVNLTLKVVTMYINSTETLNNFVKFSRDNGIVDGKNNANGYYEVSESFTYAGTYSVFNDYGGDANENAISNGFAGTFEGNGNTISNLSVTHGGLFGKSNASAKIQNISFVNAGKVTRANGSGGFFSAVTRSLYKNVYISINDNMTTKGQSWASDSSIFGFTSDGARYYNIVVDYVNIDSSNGGTYYPHLMPTPTNNNTWSNVLSVGTENKICVSGGPTAAKNCYAVTSWDEVATCGIDLMKFTTENDGAAFWTIKDGKPVPKNLA